MTSDAVFAAPSGDRRRTTLSAPSRSILVTGASQGIGLATVRRFWRGTNPLVDFVLVSRPSDHYAAAVDALRSDNPHAKRVTAYELDVGDGDALRALMSEVAAVHGNIDFLVNNAGYTSPVPIHEIEFDDFTKTINVNLYAPFLIVQSLLHAGNRFHTIVNIASTAGITGRAGWLTYSASKAGLVAMSSVMKAELAIYDTRVVCISPGRCATSLRRTLAPDEDPATIMQPEDVAGVIEMLASPIGRFVDSENLVVRL